MLRWMGNAVTGEGVIGLGGGLFIRIYFIGGMGCIGCGQASLATYILPHVSFDHRKDIVFMFVLNYSITLVHGLLLSPINILLPLDNQSATAQTYINLSPGDRRQWGSNRF